MFHDGYGDWDTRDRALELADACVSCERHVSVCRCNVRTLPRLRVARPLPDRAGDLLAFPTSQKDAAPGWYPDAA